MIGWIIVLGVIILLALLLWTPGVLYVSYQEEQTILRVSYFGVSIYDSGREEKKTKRRFFQKKRKRKSAVQSKPKQKVEQKKSLRDHIAFWKPILGDICHGLRWLWKGISIHQLTLHIHVGRFDAKDCAMAYGKTNMIVYQTLGFFKQFFTIKKEDVGVYCVFGQEETTYRLRFRMKLRPIAVLAAGCSFLLSMIVRMIRDQWNTAAKQNQKGGI